MAFTDPEKARIKHFLKYPAWQGVSNGIQLGIPVGSQAMFLVDQSFTRLTAGGEASVRADLAQLECIELQMGEARRRFKATTIGDLKTNQLESQMLRVELEEWRQKLSDDLGAPINPYTLEGRGGGGINARVVG